MKAYSLILFFISLNLSLYLINETHVLPATPASESVTYSSPTVIQTRFLNLTAIDIVSDVAIFSVPTILGWLTGNLAYGILLALVLLVLDRISGIIGWVFTGFPKFVEAATINIPNTGAAIAITSSVYGLMAFIWFWFFISLIGQRTVEQ